MSPPRGKGRGRGRRGGDRRLSIDSVTPNPKRRERGSSGGGRGGGGGSSAGASPRPMRTVTTIRKKLVVRNLPPTASEHEVRERLQTLGLGHACVWRFVPGRQRSSRRDPTPARVYLDLKREPERARNLIAALHGQLLDLDGKDKTDGKPMDVEFAPFQRLPREKQRADAKLGSIDREPEYVAFLEKLTKPKDKLPSAEAVVDTAEGETREKPVAALVKYLNERKVRSRDKGKGNKAGGKAVVKNARRQKGKKADSKQNPTQDKPKPSNDRKKKSSGDAVDVKSRKQRGRASLKKESTKQEPAEPGMLRIMTPKPVAAVDGSTFTPAVKWNGSASSTDVPLERGSEKRSSKGGKKNGSRGRTNPQKSKDGIGGADGEGINLKPHSRRKGGNGGKKEPSNKGERKKKVFAPKDATAQGTPSKS